MCRSRYSRSLPRCSASSKPRFGACGAIASRRSVCGLTLEPLPQLWVEQEFYETSQLDSGHGRGVRSRPVGTREATRLRARALASFSSDLGADSSGRCAFGACLGTCRHSQLSAADLEPSCGRRAPTLYGMRSQVILVLVAINQSLHDLDAACSSWHSAESTTRAGRRLLAIQGFWRMIYAVMWTGVISHGAFRSCSLYNDFPSQVLLFDASKPDHVPAIPGVLQSRKRERRPCHAVATQVRFNRPLIPSGDGLPAQDRVGGHSRVKIRFRPSRPCSAARYRMSRPTTRRRHRAMVGCVSDHEIRRIGKVFREDSVWRGNWVRHSAREAPGKLAAAFPGGFSRRSHRRGEE